MGQRAPTLGQIAVAVAFAFSCFGLLLFLWSAFGGPIPFKPEGYQVKVPFTEATQLAVESDVRISNVSVGKVKEIEVGDEGDEKDQAVATLEIDDAYAPIPEDTRAMLRSKTLLGETYVELTQGTEGAPTLPEGGSLAKAQVTPSVQLDEIFRTFDERTRVAFQTWMQQAALAFEDRGVDFSAAIANLEPFAEDANRVLRVLDSQQGAVSQVIRNTGEVFTALSERQGQLRGLIRNSGAVFATTARRNQDLRETFIALPTFLDESRLTLSRLQSFSRNTNPLITQLHPAARALSADLKPIARVAPRFRDFFAGLRKIEKRSVAGLPALQRLLNAGLPPLLTELEPFTQQLNPMIAEIGRYRRDITGFLGNVTGATQAQANTELNEISHYIRSSAPLYPESLAAFTEAANPGAGHRLTYSRANPYVAPGSALSVLSGLPTFDTRACAGPPGVNATLQADGVYTGDPDFANRATFDSPQEVLDFIKQFAFRDRSATAGLPTPACVDQPPQPSLGRVNEGTDYTHVYSDP